MATLYPIRAVAKITGLSVDTLRAWERRYKAVEPERSERGRQYGPESIDRLLLLKQLVERGHAIGGIATRSDAELRAFLAEPSKNHPPPAAPSTDMIGPVLTAVENFDSVRAADELNRLAALLSPRDLIYRVVLPLMVEVGTRWHSGTFAIAQEHLISQMLRTLLGNMTRLFRPTNSETKMVFVTPSGESHEFGILAAAMLASLAGLEPVYLGPNLPAREIANSVRAMSAKAVAWGVTFPHESAQEELRTLAAALPEDVELLIGGPGSSSLDLSKLGRKTSCIKDLPSFEEECQRLRSQS